MILEKIREWREDEKAMELIPNLLVKLYKDDIKPIFDEMGLST